jgi:hypothetical protein
LIVLGVRLTDEADLESADVVSSFTDAAMYA